MRRNDDFPGIDGNQDFRVNHFREFLLCQLKVNPKDRATAKDLLKHPFISAFTPLKKDIEKAAWTNDEKYMNELFDTFTDFGSHIDEALRIATRRNLIGIVKTILSRFDGEKASLINRSEALIWPAMNGDIEMLKLLMKHEVDVNVMDGNKFTLLHVAIINNHRSVVEHLLSHPDIDVNCQDYAQRTPLHYVCRNVYLHLIELLLANTKCKVDIRDRKGRTPKQLAQEWLNDYESKKDARYEKQIANLKEVINFMELKEKEMLERERQEQQQ